MTAQVFPTWGQKMKALRDAIAWAAFGICGDWKFKKEAFSLPDDLTPWFELRLGRISETGVDEVRYVDNIDSVTAVPDLKNPRKDVIVSQRQFTIEARFFSRDQEHDTVAWIVADRARSRLRLPYARDRFFKPVGLSIVEFLQIISMPTPEQVVSMRWQSEALFEMEFFTTLCETDNAAVGSWIEHVEISSDLKNPGGVPLDSSIQLDNEVMP